MVPRSYREGAALPELLGVRAIYSHNNRQLFYTLACFDIELTYEF